jgi:hypothetical protein
MRLFLAVLILSGGAFAQQASSSPGMTDEDVAAIFKGAPDAYLAQWNSTREQFRAIGSDMSALAQHPDHLTESMKALFRVQATHQMLASLMGGARKYQNPALADLIESVAAEANSDIDRFEKHLLELADEKEQQFTVADREAQRCRAILSRQPAAPAATNRKPQ